MEVKCVSNHLFCDHLVTDWGTDETLPAAAAQEISLSWTHLPQVGIRTGSIKLKLQSRRPAVTQSDYVPVTLWPSLTVAAGRRFASFKMLRFSLKVLYLTRWRRVEILGHKICRTRLGWKLLIQFKYFLSQTSASSRFTCSSKPSVTPLL